jgi:hypothetical protein
LKSALMLMIRERITSVCHRLFLVDEAWTSESRRSIKWSEFPPRASLVVADKVLLATKHLISVRYSPCF